MIPRAHHRDVAALATSDPELAGRLLADAAAVAADLDLPEFRLVLNTGATAGQSVFHVHAHVMAGPRLRLAPRVGGRPSMVSAESPDRKAAPPHRGASMAESSQSEPSSHTEHRVVVPSSLDMVSLLGSGDVLLREVERLFPDVDIHVRGNQMRFTGPASEVALVEQLVDEMVAVVRTGQGLSVDAVGRSVSMLRDREDEHPADVLTHNILSNRGKTITAKTLNQKRYVDAIDKNTITFAVGPAGTGKTYLAVAKAVQALQAKQITRIILTRPAVEAGERLGFLPGTLSEKIDPYLRPLYDALHDMMEPATIPRLDDRGHD